MHSVLFGCPTVVYGIIGRRDHIIYDIVAPDKRANEHMRARYLDNIPADFNLSGDVRP